MRIRAIWCHQVFRGSYGNFGDELSAALFKARGIELALSSWQNAELVCVGSILDSATPDFRGVVLGTGIAYEEHRQDLRHLRVPLLRGVLTAERCRLEGMPRFGDPGIIASDLLVSPAPPKDKRYGIIPHYVDQRSPAIAEWLKTHPDTLVINVLQPPAAVVRHVARCEAIISSSLHGCIVADSLGVPSRWIEFSDRVLGRGFKFRDYYSVYGDAPRAATSIDQAFSECAARDCTSIKTVVRQSIDEFVDALCRDR